MYSLSLHDALPICSAEVITNGRRDDDERIEARLCEREEVGHARWHGRRKRCRQCDLLFHACASDVVSVRIGTVTVPAFLNRTCCERNVRTSDVASVSAPTTTCAVLMATFFSDQMTNAPSTT